MHACMHTYIHTYIHTYVHTHIHTYIHACIHTYIRTYTHTYIHACMHTYIQCMYDYVCVYIYICVFYVAYWYHLVWMQRFQARLSCPWWPRPRRGWFLSGVDRSHGDSPIMFIVDDYPIKIPWKSHFIVENPSYKWMRTRLKPPWLRTCPYYVVFIFSSHAISYLMW